LAPRLRHLKLVRVRGLRSHPLYLEASRDVTFYPQVKHDPNRYYFNAHSTPTPTNAVYFQLACDGNCPEAFGWRQTLSVHHYTASPPIVFRFTNIGSRCPHRGRPSAKTAIKVRRTLRQFTDVVIYDLERPVTLVATHVWCAVDLLYRAWLQHHEGTLRDFWISIISRGFPSSEAAARATQLDVVTDDGYRRSVEEETFELENDNSIGKLDPQPLLEEDLGNGHDEAGDAEVAYDRKLANGT
jgi:hypothetical protein